MIALYVLLGLGLVVGLVDAFDDDDDDDAAETETATSETETVTSGQTVTAGQTVTLGQDGNAADFIVSSELESTFNASVSDLAASGALTPEEQAAIASGTQFVPAPLNVDAGEGDDAVLGGQGDDTIQAGQGDDLVIGGTGDDSILLGAGNDTYGINQFSDDDVADARSIYGSESSAERGNDFVNGNRGNDILFDGFGADTLDGGNGNDIINALDQGEVLPDTVIGGNGNDTLVVDQGDDVSLGDGKDRVQVQVDADDLSGGVLPAVINDYVRDDDTLSIAVRGGSVVTQPVLSVVPLADGAGSSILLDGVAVANVLGADGLALTEAELEVFGATVPAAAPVDPMPAPEEPMDPVMMGADPVGTPLEPVPVV